MSRTIRGLQEFLDGEGLVVTESLSNLANTTVGIDGSWWSKQIEFLEPFQVAMGGLPLTLLNCVRTDLRQWTSRNVTPVLVFNGLTLPRPKFNKGGSSSSSSSAAPSPVSVSAPSMYNLEKRNQGWDYYNQDKISEAMQAFQSSQSSLNYKSQRLFKDVYLSSSLLPPNFVRNTLPAIFESNAQFFTAPYYSWAQLAHFYNQGLVKSVVGPLELLLFREIKKIIISVDFKTGQFRSVSMGAILERMQIGHDAFVEICLLAGFELIKPYPQYSSKSFREIAESHRNYGSGRALIQSAQHLTLFTRAKCAITYMPVLDSQSCICKPNNSPCPNNLQEVTGIKLPNEVYFLLALGILGPQTLNNVITGTMLETPPMVDTPTYRNLIIRLVPLRATTIAVLLSMMPPQVSEEIRVSVSRYCESAESELPISDTSFLVARLSDLSIVTQSQITPFLSNGPSQSPETLSASLNIHTVTRIISSISLPVHAPSPLEINTADELFSTVFSHLFLMIGFHEFDKKNMLGEALKLFDGDQIEFAIEFLLLFHFGVFDDVQDPLSILTRVFTILPAQLNEADGWQGPLDKELMGFNSSLKAVSKTVRSLVELLLARLIQKATVRCSNQVIISVGYELPFMRETSTALGIMLKETLALNSDLAAAQQVLVCCDDIAGDLASGVRFWDSACKAIALLSKNLSASFVAANELLVPLRPAVLQTA